MNLAKLLERKSNAAVFQSLREISSYSKRFHLKSYLVGGGVRDLFLSRSLQKDCDVTVSGGNVLPLAESLSLHWGAELIRYPTFLTFTLKHSDGSFLDLATAREEDYPKQGSLPLVKRGTLLSDLLRRDFSVNAMALSLNQESWGELLDPLGGVPDLEIKEIKVLHSRSFEDDPTRLFRAARFASRFSFRLEKNTKARLEEAVQKKYLLSLSADRIRAELEKILLEKNPFPAIQLLDQWGILKQISPGILWNYSKGLNKCSLKAEKRISFLLAWLFLKNRPSSVKLFLERYNFSNGIGHELLGNLNLVEFLWNKKNVLELPQERISANKILFFDRLKHSGMWNRLKNPWKQYIHWCQSRPLLDGEDLKKLGFKPGPIYREILRSAAIQKSKGRLKNRAEECRFIVDNFRRD